MTKDGGRPAARDKTQLLHINRKLARDANGRSHTTTHQSPTEHRIVSNMCLCDLSMETHFIDEVKFTQSVRARRHPIQVVIVVSCGSITVMKGAPSVRSQSQLDAILWAATRLGLPDQPMPVTRFAV